MKTYLTSLLLAAWSVSLAQSTADAAVQLSVTTQLSPAEITLHWPTNATTTQYQIFRKLKSSTTWGSMVAALQGNLTQYTDNNVSVGTNYEYKVVRVGSNYTGYGYINCGIEVPAIEYRGKLILIVDSTFISTLAPELSRLVDDIEGDGWEVTRHDVDRNGSVTHVKSRIVNTYNLDPVNTKAVFLFGHVPVPYSGNLNPDAHSNHLGAWPADVYYGDVNGVWTDQMGPTTTASPVRTQNLPGDGKFDQSLVPGDVELQVGRVDLSSMTSFSATGNEEQLLKNYLDKDHAYRKKLFVPNRQAVIDDNFGYFSGEAFAASGYKNFAPLVGSGNISAADYITSLNSNSYLWSYGCGGGSFSSASGIGNTAAIANATLQGVFTVLFGSYFGDWDVPNNFLRAPLASGSMLTNVWSGRPHYQFHHMGLGENIGYSLIMTQNQAGGLYFASPFAITGKWIHNALMGDPTLRNNIVAPVSNVVATKVGYDCHISWTASTETNIAGYNIYVKNDTNTTYTKLNSTPIAGTTYTDQCLKFPGIYKYMVRSLKLENTPSGTYYNMSEGIADTALNNSNTTVLAAFNTVVSGNQVNLVNNSTNAISYSWNFGNGSSGTSTNASTTYTANGIYTITLISQGHCEADTLSKTVSICHWKALASFSANLSNGTVQIQNNSGNATTYHWNFGDGNTSSAATPVITYTADGTYTIMLIASNSCSSDTANKVLEFSTTGLQDLEPAGGFQVFPNPAQDQLHISSLQPASLRIISSAGKVVYEDNISVYYKNVDISLLDKGMYLVELRTGEALYFRKFIRE